MQPVNYLQTHLQTLHRVNFYLRQGPFTELKFWKFGRGCIRVRVGGAVAPVGQQVHRGGSRGGRGNYAVFISKIWLKSGAHK